MEHSVTTDESMKQTISCKKNCFRHRTSGISISRKCSGSAGHKPYNWPQTNCDHRSERRRKTTLVKLLKGLLKPVGGSIYYGGCDMAEKTVAMLAGEIGYVFQNPDDQIFKYHVIDEVMFGPQNIGMTKEQAKEKAVAALKLVGWNSLQTKILMIWNCQSGNWLRSLPFLRWIQKCSFWMNRRSHRTGRAERSFRKWSGIWAVREKRLLRFYTIWILWQRVSSVWSLWRTEKCSQMAQKRKCLHRRMFWSRQGSTSRIWQKLCQQLGYKKLYFFTERLVHRIISFWYIDAGWLFHMQGVSYLLFGVLGRSAIIRKRIFYIKNEKLEVLHNEKFY